MIADRAEPMMDLRKLYDCIRPEDRAAVVEWAPYVAALERPVFGSLRAWLRVELSTEMTPDGEPLTVTGLPAYAVQQAFEHWDRGEKWGPNNLRDLGLG
jgi:hypothetical protein